MSETVILAILTLISTMFTGVMAYMVARLNKLATATHILVNSNMGVQLKLNMELSNWKADQTKIAADREAADAAARMFHEHEAKQGVVDAKEGKS